MTVPILLFGFLLSSLYGALFHLWRDGGLGRLLLYLILSWVGFWIGQIAAGQFGWEFASVGALHVGTATFTALIFLLIGNWLSLVQVERPS
jgi:hypothetical protein